MAVFTAVRNAVSSPTHCETVLAWVLAAAWEKGYEAGLQLLESMGVPYTPDP